MFNPRWPHTLTILGESLDTNGLPVTDDNGDPVENVLPVERICYDSAWNPLRSADGSFKTETVSSVPWGYRTSTGGIKASGEVIVADYKISCPMLLTDIPTGTLLSLTDSTHTFRATVLKATTYNWGTNLWIDNVKN